MVRTNIIATLGPSSGNYTVLRKMVEAGLDVVRLNFSHGSREQHIAHIELVRRINKKYRRHIRIMGDLEGFRIRVGRFSGSKTRVLNSRSVVWLTNDPEASGPRTIPFDYQGDLGRIGPGQHIFIDDGLLVLRVKSTSGSSIKAEVVEGGVLVRKGRGVNNSGRRSLNSRR